MLYKMRNSELKIELGKFDEDISIVRMISNLRNLCNLRIVLLVHNTFSY